MLGVRPMVPELKAKNEPIRAQKKPLSTGLGISKKRMRRNIPATRKASKLAWERLVQRNQCGSSGEYSNKAKPDICPDRHSTATNTDRRKIKSRREATTGADS